MYPMRGDIPNRMWAPLPTHVGICHDSQNCVGLSHRPLTLRAAPALDHFRNIRNKSVGTFSEASSCSFAEVFAIPCVSGGRVT